MYRKSDEYQISGIFAYSVKCGINIGNYYCPDITKKGPMWGPMEKGKKERSSDVLQNESRMNEIQDIHSQNDWSTVKDIEEALSGNNPPCESIQKLHSAIDGPVIILF